VQNVLTLILGGGRGAGLYPLTRRRSEPAVPLAGKYRLIDIPVSNCINSGCNRVYVLTQYLSVSLHRHIAATYKFSPFSSGFIEVLAAQQTNEAADWYRGTADAVRQNIRYVHQDPCTDVLVLYGDQLYRMDFARLVRAHRASGADVTLAVLPVTAAQAAAFGVVRVDAAGRVVDFVEKPAAAEQLVGLRTPAAWMEARGVPGRGREYLASMGIYLLRREALFHLLNASLAANDLATEVFLPALATLRFEAHLFDGFWEDLGTIRSYHAAHLALAGDNPPFDFHSPEGVIYTHMRYLPASRVHAASVRHSLVSDGCVIGSGARLERAVLGVRSQVGRNVTLRDAVLLGANDYDGPAGGAPALGVGDDSVLERVIVDKNCRIGRGVRIVNQGKVQEAEGENYVIRDGIVVLFGGAVVPDGAII
jgi:glucose-1-phosphate adenylyltransferase